MPRRRSDNEKRRLHPSPDVAALARLGSIAIYHGISKHKQDPLRFRLPLYTLRRGDETLCDAHANFEPTDMNKIPAMLTRGIRAGLIGKHGNQDIPSMLWVVSDPGWIFEARITNVGAADYHGYPVRPSEAIAEQVYQRFQDWVNAHGSNADRQAAANCRVLYGLRS